MGEPFSLLIIVGDVQGIEPCFKSENQALDTHVPRNLE